MKDLVERMNDILNAWKSNFDVTSMVQLKFSLNEEDRLCLNEQVIHMPTDLNLASVEFNAERIVFYFAGTRKILVIGIKWPEDATPEVDTINFGYEGV